MKKKCIALYSGGLDSILAVKLMQEQSIDVVAVNFCTLFGYDVLLNPEKHREYHQKTYGFTSPHAILPRHMSGERSEHGYGKHLNPCIDCKIRMFKRARSMLEEMDASFVVTGEVLGQRPMSQRRDAMNLIEKKSGLKDILVRPLCAKHLPPSLPEQLGIIDRERLLDAAGRGRKTQIELALKYGIEPSAIPNPAGGCLLTDEQISRKVRSTFERFRPGKPSRPDIVLDIAGRKFMLDENTVLVISRSEDENRFLASQVWPGNVFLKIADVPGPLSIVGNLSEENLRIAAALCLRYGKGRGTAGHVAVYGPDPESMIGTVDAPVVEEDFCRRFQIDLNK